MRALCSPSFLAFLGAVLSILEVVEATRSGLHILHQYCECTQRDHKTVVSWVDGYDGETIVYYDPDNKTFVATRRFAQRVVDKRNANSYFVESIPEQIASLCDRIKRLAISTNATWERKAPTHTRAFMQKKRGQMYLVCTAKNFFPRGIKVHWVRNGKVADSGSDVTNIVPQSNGTFQVRSVRSLDGDSQGYVCQMEHEAVSGKLVIPLEHKALVENEALIIVGAVLGILGLCAMAVTGILYCCTSEGVKRLDVQPTAKFNNQAGLCRLNTCGASVRSSDSDASSSSARSGTGVLVNRRLPPARAPQQASSPAASQLSAMPLHP